MTSQLIVFSTLVAALVLFAAGPWRYDVVALLALLTVTLTGVVPWNKMFSGFAHPAVVTVAAVLVVSRGLRNSGAVDPIAKLLSSVGKQPMAQMGALTAAVAVCSAFMNNVGALALMMPVAIQIARRNGYSESLLLMPLAFGSLLGGMTTLIGTPPNIIIAEFRAQPTGTPFRMFDFTPVGGVVAVAGVAFIALVGWRLVPQRRGQASREELFQIKEYTAEVRVPEKSKLVGRFVYDVEALSDADVTVVGLIRAERRVLAPSSFESIRADDLILVEGDTKDIQSLVDAAGLELVGTELENEEALGSEEVGVVEALVMPDASVEGATAQSLNLRWRYGINLLAVARQGSRQKERLKSIRFQAGDVLLLQGAHDRLREALPALGCLPLAERDLQLGRPRRLITASSIFLAAMLSAAIGLLPVQVAFTIAGVVMVMARLLTLREVYGAIDWSIIVLLGAFIPVGEAMQTTGGAQLVANHLLVIGSWTPAWVSVGALLVATMFLSDLVNNAAAAVLMAPIAVALASGLGVSSDPLLMSVAIGASCAFLTPIGHQSNTLVMGPGGYHFADYWRLGLALEAIIVAVSIPLLLWFWPL